MRFALAFLCLLISGGTIAQETRPKVRVADDIEVAKAVITDPNGQPLPESMPLGEMVVFSFKRSVRGASPQSMKAIIEPPERAARAFFSDDGLTAYVPTGLKPVVIACTLIVAKGDIPDWTRISVKCGEGPIPPPGPTPDPDPPKPDPTPPIPTATHLRLIVIDDTRNPTSATSAIMLDRKFWDGLKDRGHSYYRISENATDTTDKMYVGFAMNALKITTFPKSAAYLHVYDDDTSKPLMPPILLPSTSEIQKLITRFTGK